MNLTKNRLSTLLVILATALALPLVVGAAWQTSNAPVASQASAIDNADPLGSDILESQLPKKSHRLIVQLASAPLAAHAQTNRSTMLHQNGELNVNSTAAQAYITQLETEQASFVSTMQNAMPNAQVATYINEAGLPTAATYQITFNGVAVDMGQNINVEQARLNLLRLPNVSAVYYDYAHEPHTYSSIPLINAQAIYQQVGGSENGGTGIKVASMDGGVHHDAPMFDGTGFDYPAGWPAGGLGDSANNNGKIIASRAYFRSWDPPSVGDENTWPGTRGTSHGVHTASTAAGNKVVADYLGITETVSGVAPAAWIMSYRVFYNSVTDNGSFYNIEGIAALEDIVRDGADVVNNSWGGGPGSTGGEGDPLNMALINAYNAGVFVSMSAGNAGPGLGTGDHPSGEYINVAASTTDSDYVSGRLSISAPVPVTSTNKFSLAFSSFGSSLPLGQVVSFTFKTAVSVDANNFMGCNPFPANSFDGVAAVISRGGCEFGVKVLNAQNAGAIFVVVHNDQARGDDILSMAGGVVGSQVTIPSVFVGYTNGTKLVNWYATHGASSQLEVDTKAFLDETKPDIIAGFSSRGPSAAGTLKPDIAAPGVNILAQGYAAATGEDRHLGFGEQQGTSMASPHVAGAAALLRQIHPAWTNAEIKSALMSTAKYMNVFNANGSPAQPLDMGAGRLDLTHAADPGVILSPPSISFGEIMSTAMPVSITMKVTNITTQTEMYTMTTLYTGGGFTNTTTLDGFTVSPATAEIGPGESAMVTITFDPATSMGVGDNQGYIILAGERHHAHAPTWARVVADVDADVLIIKNDATTSLGRANYIGYYTEALDELGLTYDIWNADARFDNPTTIAPAAVLNGYDMIIYYTGDNFQPDGTFGVSTAPTALDMDILNEYANSGGTLIAMGHEMAAVLSSTDPDNANFLYSSTFGGHYLQSSVTNNGQPTNPIVPHADAPSALNGASLDLKEATVTEVMLTGGNEVPPVDTANRGMAKLWFNGVDNELHYDITLTANAPFSLTAAHIHTGTVGTNGPVIYNFEPVTQTTYITDSFNFSGSTVLTGTVRDALLNGDLYINVHTTDHLAGELRGQISVGVSGDGAQNQRSIDEIKADPNTSPEPIMGDYHPYVPLMVYGGSHNEEEGVVAMSNRDQPTLEYPAISFHGKVIYTTFGLEGVNNGSAGYLSRSQLLGAFRAWAMDTPMATISDTTGAYTATGQQIILTANITNGVSYRWDFGDGSPYTNQFSSNTIGHTYGACGTYNVRVEATNHWGNKVITSQEVEVTQNCSYYQFMPMISQ